jgi:flagellar hook-associated protein 3 FlgL
MKTTLVSTSAMQNAVRLAVQRAQAEVTSGQIEVTTGRHADIGIALGSKTTRTISLHRDVARIDSMLNNNALVTQRLTVSQNVLGQMAGDAQNMLETLITVSSSGDQAQLNVAKRGITAALEGFIGLANTASGGEFLFAGVNTDVRPMQDYFAAGSPAKQAFDDAFFDRFGFAQSDPQTSTITAADMEDFLDNWVVPLFEGADWTANWSAASDTNMTSRITNTELVESSTNANTDAFRKFAMAAVVGVEMLEMNLNGDARALLSSRSIQLAGDAIAAVDAQRAQLGVAEARVTKANDALSAQKGVVAVYIGELEGIDPYEAATRMTTLLTQMEASYSLTARLQRLSLMNYL